MLTPSTFWFPLSFGLWKINCYRQNSSFGETQAANGEHCLWRQANSEPVMSWGEISVLRGRKPKTFTFGKKQITSMKLLFCPCNYNSATRQRAIKHGVGILTASFSLGRPGGRVLLHDQLCAFGNSIHVSEPQSKDRTGFWSSSCPPLLVCDFLELYHYCPADNMK